MTPTPTPTPTSIPTEAVGLRADLAVRRLGFQLDVALSVEPGTTLGLVGPNGAGKSTIVEVLAGLVPLDRGRLTLGPRVLDDPATDRFVPPEERNIGVVFQDYLLFEHLDVLDNVAFPFRHRAGTVSDGGRGRGWGRAAARQAAQPLLDALELTELANQHPRQLSGGQAQRVALARALSGRPDLLLLDEPLAAVDVSTRARLRPLLVEHLTRFTGPRVVITHDPGEALALADHLVVVEGGRVTQRGTGGELQRHPATPWVAALTGTNLLSGRARASRVAIDGSEVTLTVAADVEGPVDAVIDPRAVSLHRERPEGSPRNTWPSTVEWTEPLGPTTRVRLGAPLPLTVDITPTSARDLGLGPGRTVWAAVKATEIAIRPR